MGQIPGLKDAVGPGGRVGGRCCTTKEGKGLETSARGCSPVGGGVTGQPPLLGPGWEWNFLHTSPQRIPPMNVSCGHRCRPISQTRQLRLEMGVTCPKPQSWPDPELPPDRLCHDSVPEDHLCQSALNAVLVPRTGSWDLMGHEPHSHQREEEAKGPALRAALPRVTAREGGVGWGVAAFRSLGPLLPWGQGGENSEGMRVQ